MDEIPETTCLFSAIHKENAVQIHRNQTATYFFPTWQFHSIRKLPCGLPIGASVSDMLIPATVWQEVTHPHSCSLSGGGNMIPNLFELVTGMLLSLCCHGGGGREAGSRGVEKAGKARELLHIKWLMPIFRWLRGRITVHIHAGKSNEYFIVFRPFYHCVVSLEETFRLNRDCLQAAQSHNTTGIMLWQDTLGI